MSSLVMLRIKQSPILVGYMRLVASRLSGSSYGERVSGSKPGSKPPLRINPVLDADATYAALCEFAFEVGKTLGGKQPETFRARYVRGNVQGLAPYVSPNDARDDTARVARYLLTRFDEVWTLREPGDDGQPGELVLGDPLTALDETLVEMARRYPVGRPAPKYSLKLCSVCGARRVRVVASSSGEKAVCAACNAELEPGEYKETAA